MKWDPTSVLKARRAAMALACVLALAFSTTSSHALTPFSFAPVQTQLNDDITTLSANSTPTRAERALLKTLGKATNILAQSSLNDGKALSKLNTLLRRKPDYTNPLVMVASNLLVTFNVEYDFVGGTLLPEVPPSADATAVTAQYNKLAPIKAKLNAATSVAKFAALFDSARGKLDTVEFAAVQLLNFPFPSELDPDSVAANINGVNFRATSTSATENQTGFEAIATETNITLRLMAIGSGNRGILFSVPNVQFGSFRYAIPTAATFTNRTNIDFFMGTEDDAGATDGAIFVGTTSNEVYGVFNCSGPGFNVTNGQFRITISRQP